MLTRLRDATLRSARDRKFDRRFLSRATRPARRRSLPRYFILTTPLIIPSGRSATTRFPRTYTADVPRVLGICRISPGLSWTRTRPESRSNLSARKGTPYVAIAIQSRWITHEMLSIDLGGNKLGVELVSCVPGEDFLLCRRCYPRSFARVLFPSAPRPASLLSLFFLSRRLYLLEGRCSRHRYISVSLR